VEGLAHSSSPDPLENRDVEMSPFPEGPQKYLHPRSLQEPRPARQVPRTPRPCKNLVTSPTVNIESTCGTIPHAPPSQSSSPPSSPPPAWQPHKPRRKPPSKPQNRNGST